MPVTRIRGAAVCDGRGGEPCQGEVWIRDDRIVSVGPACALNADETVDADGRVVCPAFVDIHRHPDAKPFTIWRGEAELRQGIATCVAGNCGISLAPAGDDPREQYAFDEPVLGRVPQGAPRDHGEYLSKLEARPLPVNMAAMVGTGSVRISIKGFSDAPFTPGEMEKARSLIAGALDAGAPGVSMGIMYLPECYGTKEEFAGMLRPAGERGKPVTAHIRGEGDSLVRSVEEVIAIAREAGCALEISHFKSCGVRNWRRQIHRAISLIEEARACGQDVACDLYPYDAGSTALTTMLPPSFVAGDMERALARLGTEESVRELRGALEREYPDWDNFAVTLGWDRIVVSAAAKEENRRFQGLSVEEGASRFGFADAVALAAHLMHTEDGKTAIINYSMCRDDIDAVARLPYSSFISDAIYADTDSPHPRMYGAMPRVIREFVRERGVLTLGEAIRKMTSLPARRMGIRDRGELREGYFADVAMFDPAAFRDNATYADPARCATGLSLLLVNGKKAVVNDEVTGAASGRCLRV